MGVLGRAAGGGSEDLPRQWGLPWRSEKEERAPRGFTPGCEEQAAALRSRKQLQGCCSPSLCLSKAACPPAVLTGEHSTNPALRRVPASHRAMSSKRWKNLTQTDRGARQQPVPGETGEARVQGLKARPKPKGVSHVSDSLMIQHFWGNISRIQSSTTWVP